MQEENHAFDVILWAVTAALAVAPCVVLAEALAGCGIDVPYLCFIPAIVGCCAVGGWPLASWALVFSALGLWYFFVPPTGFGWPEYGDAAHLIVFIGVSYFVCWIIEGQRRANDALSRDNVALGYKISALIQRVKAH
jgi:K+-sensing histidine kinase KdpD